MATGRNNQLTKQIGENLVVAELGRRGYIATTFTGNVPEFDILAANETAKVFPIQVKAINGVSWQFDIRSFLEVHIEEGEQVIQGKIKKKNRELVCIFVRIGEQGEDEFYLFRWGFLQDYFYNSYKGRKPPRNVDSFHCAIWLKDLQEFKNNWEILNEE